MKTTLIVRNAAELLTAEHALILKKIIRIIKTSVHQRILKKSGISKRCPVMLMDENEAKNIDNENRENERRERISQ